MIQKDYFMGRNRQEASAIYQVIYEHVQQTNGVKRMAKAVNSSLNCSIQ